MTKSVQHRRRREKKTDYKKRLNLLKSGEKRLVVRKHINDTVAQIVGWNEDGDETVAQADAKQLMKIGWKGHPGNLPSAYLIGYLLGMKAGERDVESAVLDIGLQNVTKENRIYAVVKGVRDAGIDIPANKSVLPSEGRIRGEHIEKYASQMSQSEKEKYFSKSLDKDLDPEEISGHFEQVKEKIEEKFE